EVFGYHCDHTRQLTLSHGPARLENSWARFIDGVERPDIPEQAETWGCAGEEIEEVTLDLGRRYVDVLRECVGSPQEKPLLADYKRETYDQTDYDPRHVLPFLVDLFLSAERSTKLAWIGARPETLALFAAAWRKLEFTSPILLTRSLAPTEVPASEFSYVSPETLGDVPNAFVFDFGLPNRGLLAPDQRRCIGREFLRIVRTEHDRLASGANARRIVCINTANSSLDPHVVQHIAAGLTPFSTRLRHGLVLAAPPAEQEWISRAQTGPAGKRDSATIRSGETDGLVCYGPRRHLFAGSYAFHVEIGWSGEITGGPERVGIIELLDRGTYVAHRAITRADLENGQVSFAFEVDEEASDDWDAYIEPRVRTFVPAPLVINAIWSELRTRTLDPPQPSLASGVDWLDALIIGPAGRWLSSGHIEIDSANEGGVIAYGPYWALPPGRYELHLISETSSEAGGMLVAEVVSGDRFRGGAVLPPNDKGRSACIVFEVHREEGPESLLIEVRLRATGALSGSVSLAMIRRIGEGLRQSPWTSPPSLGDDYERCA
ncbi:MAG: hypothetical protein QOD74_945, partial [Variibacter sp.]|nr:hypothetical protein [Variibacter sp.]